MRRRRLLDLLGEIHVPSRPDLDLHSSNTKPQLVLGSALPQLRKSPIREVACVAAVALEDAEGVVDPLFVCRDGGAAGHLALAMT